jgi:hypothetical protein
MAWLTEKLPGFCRGANYCSQYIVCCEIERQGACPVRLYLWEKIAAAHCRAV